MIKKTHNQFLLIKIHKKLLHDEFIIMFFPIIWTIIQIIIFFLWGFFSWISSSTVNYYIPLFAIYGIVISIFQIFNKKWIIPYISILSNASWIIVFYFIIYLFSKGYLDA